MRWVVILNRMVTVRVTLKQSMKGASQDDQPQVGLEYLGQKEEPVQRPGSRSLPSESEE